jgi:protein-disulfide isomerase
LSTKKPGGNPARAGEAEDAREARRKKAAALRQRELARERSRRVVLISIAVVVVLALVAVVVVVIRRASEPTATAAQQIPASAGAAGAGYVLPGTPAAGAPTVDIWVDYQCPYCKQFETAAGESYLAMAAAGQAKVVVHTLTFLDGNLGNTASQLAAEGAAAAEAQGKFPEYTTTVFANQPKEGVGYTVATLRDLAKEAGVPDLDAWQKAVEGHAYRDYVDSVEDSMKAAGVSGTPTITVTPVGGEKKEIPTADLLGSDPAGALQQAVTAATAAP